MYAQNDIILLQRGENDMKDSRIYLRVTTEFKEKLKSLSEKSKKTLQAYILEALKEKIDKDEFNELKKNMERNQNETTHFICN